MLHAQEMSRAWSKLSAAKRESVNCRLEAVVKAVQLWQKKELAAGTLTVEREAQLMEGGHAGMDLLQQGSRTE